jgi:hypothetical protein
MNLCLSHRNFTGTIQKFNPLKAGHHVAMIIFQWDAAAQRPYPFLMVGSSRRDDRQL